MSGNVSFMPKDPRNTNGEVLIQIRDLSRLTIPVSTDKVLKINGLVFSYIREADFPTETLKKKVFKEMEKNEGFAIAKMQDGVMVEMKMSNRFFKNVNNIQEIVVQERNGDTSILADNVNPGLLSSKEIKQLKKDTKRDWHI